MEDTVKDKVVVFINANTDMNASDLAHKIIHDLIFGGIAKNVHVNIDEVEALIDSVRNPIPVVVEPTIPIEATNTPTDEGSTIK